MDVAAAPQRATTGETFAAAVSHAGEAGAMLWRSRLPLTPVWGFNLLANFLRYPGLRSPLFLFLPGLHFAVLVHGLGSA